MTGPVISDERESAALGAPAGTVPPAVVRQLSTLDRWLPLWIGVAMGVGLGLGALIPGLESALSAVAIGGTSLPIAIGLLLMMYPVLARVRYEELGHLRGERGLFVSSLVLNWVIGPLLMFALAWLLLPHDPEYRTGLIVVGLARCIAMVLVWSELACADREATAVLVAINSVFQVVAYSLLGWFYLTVLPGWLGLDTEGFSVGIWEVARTVLIFLGIPLAAGYLTRVIGLRRRGREWYEGTFIPRIAPITLYGLLFTIVLLFALQGHQITGHPARRGADRRAAPHLLRADVHHRVPLGPGIRLRLPAHRDACVDRRLEQTSSWRSRWRSASSAPPPARRWRESSGR